MGWSRGYEHHEDPPEEGSAVYGGGGSRGGESLKFSPYVTSAFLGGLVGFLAGFAISMIPAVHNLLIRLGPQGEGLRAEIDKEYFIYGVPVLAGVVLGAGVGLGIEAYRHFRNRNIRR